MASLNPDYNYDIFISYRQKDNRSQWVTDFTQALKAELDATFKEDVSIYFDANPHEGLFETHDVDASLKEKIKCLVFIPIVSQTYCDPQSFAWQKEFLPFLAFARNDTFGLDITLDNGNVTKRVLPVRIHEIDALDKKLIEDALGSVLRPVNFSYQEAGVNRPLLISDQKHDNLDKLDYRNQINKVANSIKAIVVAMKGERNSPNKRAAIPSHAVTANRPKKSTFLIAGLLAVLTLSVYLFLKKEDPKPRPSLAVLPFLNLSPETKDEYLSNGFYEEIIQMFSTQRELVIISKTSSDNVAKAGLSSSEIGKILNVEYLLSGSLRRDGDDLRITARLEESATGKVIGAWTYDRKMDNYFGLLKEVSLRVATEIDILLSKGIRFPKSTENLKAWEHWVRSKNSKQLENLDSAVRYDSTFVQAWSAMASLNLANFGNTGDSSYLRKANLARKKLEALDKGSYYSQVAELAYDYWALNDLEGVIIRCNKALELYPFSPSLIFRKSVAHRRLGHLNDFATGLHQLLQIDPMNYGVVNQLAITMEALGQITEARKLLRKIEGFPSTISISLNHRSTLAMIENNTDALDSIIELARSSEIPEKEDFLSAITWSSSVLKAFKSRDYASLIKSPMWHNRTGHFDWDDDLNLAFTYRLMHDDAKSNFYFEQVKRKTDSTWSARKEGRLFAVYVRGLCQAALGDPEWESAFKVEVTDLIFQPDYFRTYALASLLAGDKKKSMNVLRRWKESNVGFLAHASGPHQAMNLLFRNHPLLDLVRDEPGFNELWTDNHLKVNPVKSI